MSIAAAILPEFDHEMANTRRTLERVPTDKFGWKPHEKSFTAGQLASHLANIPSWVSVTIGGDVFDMNPTGGERPKTPAAASTEEALATFDKNVGEARQALESASDEHLMKVWTLKNAGADVLSMPRAACVRTFVLNHNIHHRAQLGLYLRLLDIPVPSIYGPSADEAI